MKVRENLPEALVREMASSIKRFGWPYKNHATGVARVMLTAALDHLVDIEVDRLRLTLLDIAEGIETDVDTPARLRGHAARARQAAASNDKHEPEEAA